MTVNWNESPILSQMRKGSTLDPFRSIEESLPVIQNRIVLTEIPNKANKLILNCSDLWNSTTTYQIGDLVYTETDGVKSSFECIVSCTNIVVTNSTYWTSVNFVEVISNTVVLSKYQYYVDYISGLVTTNNYFNNNNLICEYLGEGCAFTPSSRIYSSSVGTEVTATLEDIISTSAKSITFHPTPPTSEDGEDGDVWFVYQE